MILNATSDTAMSETDINESIDQPSPPSKVVEPVAKSVRRCKKTRSLHQGPPDIESIRNVSTYQERWLPLQKGEKLRLNRLNFIKGEDGDTQDLRFRQHLLTNNLKSFNVRLKREADQNLGEAGGKRPKANVKEVGNGNEGTLNVTYHPTTEHMAEKDATIEDLKNELQTRSMQIDEQARLYQQLLDINDELKGMVKAQKEEFEHKQKQVVDLKRSKVSVVLCQLLCLDKSRGLIFTYRIQDR